MVDVDSCIKFLDTKKNNIMDGKFTKLLYSNEYALFNGLYILCPIIRNVSNTSYKNNFTFHPHISNNLMIIQQLSHIEKKLITFYKQYNTCNKKHVYSLQNQLYSGTIKVYQDIVKNNSLTKYEANMDMHNLNECLFLQSFYVIKISGIWETSDTIGITYKFLEMYR